MLIKVYMSKKKRRGEEKREEGRGEVRGEREEWEGRGERGEGRSGGEGRGEERWEGRE